MKLKLFTQAVVVQIPTWNFFEIFTVFSLLLLFTVTKPSFLKLTWYVWLSWFINKYPLDFQVQISKNENRFFCDENRISLWKCEHREVLFLLHGMGLQWLFIFLIWPESNLDSRTLWWIPPLHCTQSFQTKRSQPTCRFH